MAATVTDDKNQKNEYPTATHLNVEDGCLYVYRKEEKKRVVPFSLLWGMINFDREIDESKKYVLAAFPPGRWSRWEAFGKEGHPTT